MDILAESGSTGGMRLPCYTASGIAADLIADKRAVDTIFQNLVERLRRQGIEEALDHLLQARSAFDRGEWESANAQVRAFLESLYNRVAEIRLKTNKKAGEARKELETSGLLRDREARLVREFIAVAGGSGSHAGVSNADEAKGRFIAGLGIAYIGLALIPELVRVEDVIAGNLNAPPGTRLPIDAEIITSCPTCGQDQNLAESEIRRDGDDTIYICKSGCQTIVVVSAPESSAWPGRGYRIGKHVIRNARDLLLPIIGGTGPGVLIPASPAALMRTRPNVVS